jgi:UDP-N-acetylmuramoyl-tripeptide--D-alanyl-D-alanine ligase
MKFRLQAVARTLGASADVDTLVTGWSIDSRTLVPGDLFFALRGPNHDGHAHVAEALRKGAVGAVVDRKVDAAGAVLQVPDTLRALQELAGWARREWSGDVVAVTGSAGKTTTKDVIAEMLSVGMETAKNEGNLNNHVGLPLSLLRIDEAARVAVLEMGMNHAGEIRRLAELARPDVGVVTNVGYAHIENFDSVEAIAAAKRELVESLGANGTAVLNADDPRVAAFAASHPGRTILYGQSPEAHVRAQDVEYDVEYLAHGETTGGETAGVRFRVGTTFFESALTGRHSVSNLLAGIAVAGVYGIPPSRLRQKVSELLPGKMRGERLRHQGVLIYNDCYNSNPDAVRAMLDVLRDTPARRRIAVLGEMLELGRWTEALHRDVGNYAAMCGIDVLVGIRGAALHMLDAAKRAGLPADAAFFFDDPAEAGRLVRTLAQPGDAILFKGSRGVHVELAMEQFVAPSGAASGRGERN